MSSTGFSAATEELIEALEDAQTGLRDLEDAIEGMKEPPEELVEAADRVVLRVALQIRRHRVGQRSQLPLQAAA
jgi:hypothetical protein